MPELTILVVTIVLALGYAYANGMNDAANAVATVISTRVLTPIVAIGMAAVLNMAGGFSGTAVAKTIGKGLVKPDELTQLAVMAAIASSIIWVVIATRTGYPVSVSPSLIASIVGAGLAGGGVGAVIGSGLIKVLLALAFSPLLGFGGGFLFMLALYWLLRRRAPATVNNIFGKLQILSAAFMSFSHGRNDAQNAIGIIALAWALYFGRNAVEIEVSVEIWMIFVSSLVIGLGTAIGGWRVIRTLGMRVTRLEPVNGFAAETTAGAVIEAASQIGLPVSTTHTIGTSIMGVGATRRLSAVRWGITRSILLAWLVTYPFCGVVAYALAKVLSLAD